MAQFDESQYSDLYCLSCLYKACITNRIVNDVEECRRSCEDFGFVQLSGLFSIYTNVLPACTYAGDNTVLSIEVIKIIVTTKPENF